MKFAQLITPKPKEYFCKKYTIVVFASVLSLFNQSTMASTIQSNYSIIEAASNSDHETILMAIDSLLWEGTTQGDLAEALSARTGFEVYEKLSSFVDREDVDKPLITLAWYHLLGYARLVGDITMQFSALEELKADPETSARLFRGQIPDSPTLLPEPDSKFIPTIMNGSKIISKRNFTIQIGAFSSKERAEKLTSNQEIKAEIVELRLKSKVLFAVRVGNYSTREEALSVGKMIYGKEGKDFTIIDLR